MGLWWDELEPGRTFATGERVVSAADVREFAALSGDAGPLHVSDAAAREAGFDGAIVHGVLGLGLVTGLVSQLGVTRGTLIALVGLRWRFRAPVRAGDTIAALLTVKDRSKTTRPDRGTVTFALDVRNQRHVLVQEGELVELIKRRKTGAPP